LSLHRTCDGRYSILREADGRIALQIDDDHGLPLRL
jgi:hypothetical protein